MHRQGLDLQLTQYDERGWRATFYDMEPFAHERDGHRVGAHAVACGPVGGMGGVENCWH